MRTRFEIGSVVAGHYVLHELVGRGGMGVVYRASQPTLARTVAIKILYEELAIDPVFVQRFHHEAVAASRIHHPSSVGIIDWGLVDGTPYLVMEDVRGVTLGQLAQRSEPVPLGRALALTRQLLTALSAVHASDVIHADVKSDNVLVEAALDGDRVRLIDFGLARLRDVADDIVARFDETGSPVVSGTPEYMAPEVIRGEAPGPGADIYGAGVILYELITGRTPFAGGTTRSIMESHLRDPVVPASIVRPDRAIPPALDHAIATALAKDPVARYADAGAFAAALGAIDAPPVLGELCACGAKRPAPGEACELCGAGAPTASGRPRITRSLRPQRAVGTPMPGFAAAPAGTEASLRAAVGAAIQKGDRAEIASAYVELAHLLADHQRFVAACAELEEAIDVITAGGGVSSQAPSAVGRVLAELAEVFRKSGDATGARRAALRMREAPTIV